MKQSVPAMTPALSGKNIDFSADFGYLYLRPSRRLIYSYWKTKEDAGAGTAFDLIGRCLGTPDIINGFVSYV